MISYLEMKKTTISESKNSNESAWKYTFKVYSYLFSIYFEIKEQI